MYLGSLCVHLLTVANVSICAVPMQECDDLGERQIQFENMVLKFKLTK